MIFLPLVYPELFERFHIAPPRGVLFYGPPGQCKVWASANTSQEGSWAGMLNRMPLPTRHLKLLPEPRDVHVQ